MEEVLPVLQKEHEEQQQLGNGGGKKARPLPLTCDIGPGELLVCTAVGDGSLGKGVCVGRERERASFTLMRTCIVKHATHTVHILIYLPTHSTFLRFGGMALSTWTIIIAL